LPRITKKLHSKFKEFVSSSLKRVSDERASEVIFRLQAMQQLELFQGSSLLALGEFGIIHFDAFGTEIIDVLLQKVGQEISSSNQNEVEAAILALKSLAGKH
jgi:hypothetical protein